MRVFFEDLRRGLREFWAPPEASLSDVGASAEPIMARVRISLTIALLVLPFSTLVFASPGQRPTSLAGLLVIAGAVIIANRGIHPGAARAAQPWLPTFTSLLDVSLVSATLLGFALIGDPHQAVNSKVVFDAYFLAIGATCLRYDLRCRSSPGSRPWCSTSVSCSGWRSFTTSITSAMHLAVRSLLLVGADHPAVPPGAGDAARHGHRRGCGGTAISQQRRADRLFNRAYFEEFLAAEVRRPSGTAKSFAVAMVESTASRTFNDQLWARAGDEALKTVAASAPIGAAERPGGALRGEEMVLVMPETTLNQSRVRLETVAGDIAGEKPSSCQGAEQVAGNGKCPEWPAGPPTARPRRSAPYRRCPALPRKALGRNRVVSSSVAAASV